MNSNLFNRSVFLVAGIYDLVLGIGFLFFPLLLFNWFKVMPPYHLSYVQFPAALLIIFAVMFFNIAQDPVGKMLLIPYGIMLKFAYCGVVFWYWLFSDISYMWKPFAIADLFFIIAFLWCYYTIRSLRLGVN